MQMIDVLQKLREIADRSPEEIGRAIAAAEKMSGVAQPVVEAKKEFPDDGYEEYRKNRMDAAIKRGVPPEEASKMDLDPKGKKQGKFDPKTGKRVESVGEAKSKPDYLDFDKDGDKKEPMKKALKDKKHVKEDDNLDKVNAVASDLKSMSTTPKLPNVNDIPKDNPGSMFTEKAKEPGAIATAQVMKMGGDYVTPDGKHLTKKGIEKRDEIIKAIESKKDESVNEDVQITLTGSDAVLAEILKLAGQIGAKTAKGPEPVAPAGPPAPLGVPSSGPLPSLDKMMGGDTMMDAFDATTTPDEEIMDLDSAIPAGDDLNKPKLTAPRVSPGDNPMQPPISFS